MVRRCARSAHGAADGDVVSAREEERGGCTCSARAYLSSRPRDNEQRTSSGPSNPLPTSGRRASLSGAAHPPSSSAHFLKLPYSPRAQLTTQPFDIVKVRIQTNPSAYTSPLDCASKILKADGPLGFYKGTLTPLLGIGVCVSIQFGALEWAKRLLSNNGEKTLGLGELYAAGAVAGVANTAVAGPVEHIRIRLQTQPAGAEKLYNGPLDCVRKLYGQGGLPGVFKGQAATMLRDGVGYG